MHQKVKYPIYQNYISLYFFWKHKHTQGIGMLLFPHIQNSRNFRTNLQPQYFPLWLFSREFNLSVHSLRWKEVMLYERKKRNYQVRIKYIKLINLVTIRLVVEGNLKMINVLTFVMRLGNNSSVMKMVLKQTQFLMTIKANIYLPLFEGFCVRCVFKSSWKLYKIGDVVPNRKLRYIKSDLPKSTVWMWTKQDSHQAVWLQRP